MIHNTPSPYKGQTIKVAAFVRHPQLENFGGSEIVIEDWWDRVYGSSWMFAQGNPACLVYAMRTGFSKVPIPNDNEVLYGHTRDGLGHLIHVTELAST